MGDAVDAAPEITWETVQSLEQRSRALRALAAFGDIVGFAGFIHPQNLRALMAGTIISIKRRFQARRAELPGAVDILNVVRDPLPYSAIDDYFEGVFEGILAGVKSLDPRSIPSLIKGLRGLGHPSRSGEFFQLGLQAGEKFADEAIQVARDPEARARRAGYFAGLLIFEVILSRAVGLVLKGVRALRARVIVERSTSASRPYSEATRARSIENPLGSTGPPEEARTVSQASRATTPAPPQPAATTRPLRSLPAKATPAETPAAASPSQSTPSGPTVIGTRVRALFQRLHRRIAELERAALIRLPRNSWEHIFDDAGRLINAYNRGGRSRLGAVQRLKGIVLQSLIVRTSAHGKVIATAKKVAKELGYDPATVRFTMDVSDVVNASRGELTDGIVVARDGDKWLILAVVESKAKNFRLLAKEPGQIHGQIERSLARLETADIFIDGNRIPANNVKLLADYGRRTRWVGLVPRGALSEHQILRLVSDLDTQGRRRFFVTEGPLSIEAAELAAEEILALIAGSPPGAP